MSVFGDAVFSTVVRFCAVRAATRMVPDLDPAVTRAALDKILARLKARGMPAFLCGMMAPRNYGPDYIAKFDSIFPDLAKKYDVPLYPFFLQGVVGDVKLNQRDGMHPTAEGVETVVRGILPAIEAWLRPMVGAG